MALSLRTSLVPKVTPMFYSSHTLNEEDAVELIYISWWRTNSALAELMFPKVYESCCQPCVPLLMAFDAWCRCLLSLSCRQEGVLM